MMFLERIEKQKEISDMKNRENKVTLEMYYDC